MKQSGTDFFSHVYLFAPLQVSSSGLFELRLDSFVNKVNRDASGRCCGQPIEGDQNCDQTCQTYFRVCFKNYQTNIDTSTECVYGQKLINVADSNDSRLNMTIRFPFSFAWPVSLSLLPPSFFHSPLTTFFIHTGHLFTDNRSMEQLHCTC